MRNKFSQLCCLLWILLLTPLSVVSAVESSQRGELSSNKALTNHSVFSNISCLVEPSMVVNIGAPVEGVLDEVSVGRSDTVSAGDVVARLRSGVEQAAIAYQSEKAQYGLRKTQRSRDLRNKQLISEQVLDDLVTEQRLAELELAQKQALLNRKIITSPVNGVVVERYKNPGDLVAQEIILRVVQIDPLFAELVLPSSMFDRVRDGERYEVMLQLSAAALEGRVVVVDRVIDPASNTFRVRLAIPNPGYKYPSGQRCKVNFDNK